jgi:hypothetical protein
MITSQPEFSIHPHLHSLVDLPERFTPTKLREYTASIILQPDDRERRGERLGTIQPPRPAIVRRVRRDQVRHCSSSGGAADTTKGEGRTQTLVRAADLPERDVVEPRPRTFNDGEAGLQDDRLVGGRYRL